MCNRIVLATLLLAIHAMALGKETLKFSVYEYPPFLSKSVPEYGLEPAIVRLAFERVGVEVQFNFMPPARALEVARQGKSDGTLGWVHSTEREGSFHYSKAISRAPLVFFHLKAKPFIWNTFQDLKGKQIGTVYKYYYGAEFHQAQDAADFQVDVVTDDVLNLRKLHAGRIDATPINLYVGYYLAHQLFVAETARLFTHNQQIMKISEHHLLLPRSLSESALRLALFNEGLDIIKQNGEYAAILERHIHTEEAKL